MLSDLQNLIIDKIIFDQPLSEEEQQIYNASKQEKEFNEELTYRHDAMLALKSVGRNEMKQELNNLNRQTKVRSLRRYLSIAAGILILMVAGWWMLSYNEPLHKELYASYFIPYENVIDPLTKGVNLERSGYQDYESGNYEKAKTKLARERTADSYFYLAMMAMVEKDYTKAQSYLESTLAENDPTYRNKVNWYQALLYVQMNQLDRAKSKLNSVAADNSNFYREKAQEILAKLEEN